MESPSTQEILLAAENRKEIIRTTKLQGHLLTVSAKDLEPKLQEIGEKTRHYYKMSETKIDNMLSVERQRKEIRQLLVEARDEKVSPQPSQSKVERTKAAMRLIDKINYMRKLTLILLTASANEQEAEYNLSLSRELIVDKTLQCYQRK